MNFAFKTQIMHSIQFQPAPPPEPPAPPPPPAEAPPPAPLAELKAVPVTSIMAAMAALMPVAASPLL
jgi:hypothetical protein